MDLFAPCDRHAPLPGLERVAVEACCANCRALDPAEGPACPEFRLRFVRVAGPVYSDKRRTEMVVAKFRVASVSEPREINQWLSDIHESGKRDVFDITLYPVSGGSPENEQFYASTPTGKIELTTVNPAAAAQFAVGQEFYVEFKEA